MLEKSFAPGEVEGRIYTQWEASGAFRAGRRPNAEPFCMVIPPPNITGRLHIGHALNNTLQDALVRFERMRGKDVLWQTGTDHAGIATQLVVERQLAERQLNRLQMGREKFLEAVWKWKDESGGAIVQQLRRLGASCDWSRERFTMDEGLSRAVLKVFVELHRQGLIYKDKRLVNWDPRLQTAVSDLEVENIEVKGHLWHLKYPIEGQMGQFITVATTRPETMLGDTAVAVHPDDPRYKALIGKQVRLPLANRLIPIVADEHSDPEKGTGAVKITPGHDFNDFEVGKRHNLPLINILNKDGSLNDNVPEAYRGLDRDKARKVVLADLEAVELVDRVEPITHSVPHDEKTKTIVLEPYMTEQWYLDVKPLAERAIKAVEDGRTKFVPDSWTGVYFNWMRNIHPWCISRQLWWGHQLPVWYDDAKNVYVAESEAEASEQARAKHGKSITLTRDPDVLDTWFSSALWPFSTLGWPGKTPELARFYPTSVLSTAFDIIFFWVARMMMMGLHFMDDVPFHTVLIHTRVLDEKGTKMSKTKGNVVDPLDLVDAYGADALRFTLARAAGQVRDMRIGPSRVEVNRNFVTKLWNVARFCELNECKESQGFRADTLLSELNRWIVAKTCEAEKKITASLKSLSFIDAANTAYHFVYDHFCDQYIEALKPVFASGTDVEKNEARNSAAWVLDKLLELLHPFVPFVTEELWEKSSFHEQSGLLIEAAWPDLSNVAIDSVAEKNVDDSMSVISDTRSIRSDLGIPPGERLPSITFPTSDEGRFAANAYFISAMSRVGGLEFKDAAQTGMFRYSTTSTIASIFLADKIDLEKEFVRLEKELKNVESELSRITAKLQNRDFVSKAPPEVIDEQKTKLDSAQQLKLRLLSTIQGLRT